MSQCPRQQAAISADDSGGTLEDSMTDWSGPVRLIITLLDQLQAHFGLPIPRGEPLDPGVSLKNPSNDTRILPSLKNPPTLLRQ